MDDNKPIIFSQPSKTRWYTVNEPLYFDEEMRFSYLSGGKRLYFCKMHDDPAIITMVKWKKEDKVENVIFLLSTFRYGPKWGYTNNPDDDFYYEDHTTYTIKNHGGYSWYVSFIPCSVDYNIDRNDLYKPISLFSDVVYDDYDQIINDILDSVDAKPLTVYSGMLGSDGIAFFAGATDLEHIEDAPFIIDCDGKEIKNIGGNRIC